MFIDDKKYHADNKNIIYSFHECINLGFWLGLINFKYTNGQNGKVAKCDKKTIGYCILINLVIGKMHYYF